MSRLFCKNNLKLPGTGCSKRQLKSLFSWLIVVWTISPISLKIGKKLSRVELKMRELVSIAADLKRQKKLEKVVLLQRIPRLDEKSKLSEFSTTRSCCRQCVWNQRSSWYHCSNSASGWIPRLPELKVSIFSKSNFGNFCQHLSNFISFYQLYPRFGNFCQCFLHPLCLVGVDDISSLVKTQAFPLWISDWWWIGSLWGSNGDHVPELGVEGVDWDILVVVHFRFPVFLKSI